MMVRDGHASAAMGLLRCLRMLAEEAEALELTRTSAALQAAEAACRTEATLLIQPPGIPTH